MSFEAFKSGTRLPAETTFQDVIADTVLAFNYASFTYKRFTEGEPAIAQNPYASAAYADIIKARFFAGEKAIIEECLSSNEAYRTRGDDIGNGMGYGYDEEPVAIWYARTILGGRWTEYEEAIIAAGDALAACRYLTCINNIDSANSRAESVNDVPYDYASLIIIPEFEPIFAKSPRYASAYAKLFLGRRWTEAEPVIMQSPMDSYRYARAVIKGRWIEAEDVIGMEAEASYYYAKEVLRDRFEKGEKAIKSDPYFEKKYEEDHKINYDNIFYILSFPRLQDHNQVSLTFL